MKSVLENCFEGHLVLEVQNMVLCNHVYNLDKQAEGYIDKKPEAQRLGLVQIQSPQTTVSPPNPASPRKVLMSCLD